MSTKQATVVTYRDLANRWSERAERARNDNGRERCQELAQAYRSLVDALDAERRLQNRAGAT
jgi:hypothetical protein